MVRWRRINIWITSAAVPEGPEAAYSFLHAWRRARGRGGREREIRRGGRSLEGSEKVKDIERDGKGKEKKFGGNYRELRISSEGEGEGKHR